VLLMGHMPLMNKIFSYGAHQERQIMRNNAFNNMEVKINVVNNHISCTIYGKKGCLEANYYRKNGFPHNGDDKGFQNVSKKVCVHYGQNIHTIDFAIGKTGSHQGISSPIVRPTLLGLWMINMRVVKIM